MAKIEVEKTELVWPGKFDENGQIKETNRINLPFQIIETINTSRAESEKRKKIGRSLYDFFEPEEGETIEDGWKNKLIWGDNELVMSSLLKKFAGKIDLIYIDPPFATGADFNFKTEIGESGEDILKTQSIIEEKAYRDTWGLGIQSYLEMLHDRLILMKELLKYNGSIYVHLDWHVGHYVKIILDEIFGKENFVNEIIRQKTMSCKAQTMGFGNMHDTLYIYSKTEKTYFVQQYDERNEKTRKLRFPEIEKNTGRRYVWDNFTQAGQGPPRKFGDRIIKPPKGKHWIWTQEKIDEGWKNGFIEIKGNMPRVKRYETPGVPAGDIWVGKEWVIHSQSSESLGYDTQKPEYLLKRIISTSCPENGIVADFFCGSGTTMAVAEMLGRRWIGCDLSKWAIHISRKRLLEIDNCKPFEILNLGKYERQYWQDIKFNKNQDKTVIFQYIAFILKLYGAQPISGTKYIHGKKGNSVVHIGSVDSPVTIDEINLCIDECLAMKQQELHILGWEWEMGLNELMINEAKSKGIKLLLFNIPREVMDPQAVERGDVKFYELAYVDVNLHIVDKKAKATLKDFAMSNIEFIPDDIRDKIKKWSDYIDYWAIDWNFQNDTFMNGWMAYRTKQNRKLELESDVHKYEKPGKYNILVKVIDIFGNDTSILKEIEAK